MEEILVGEKNKKYAKTQRHLKDFVFISPSVQHGNIAAAN